jgi:HAD superfamily hydrolase (TIGR01549 family)
MIRAVFLDFGGTLATPLREAYPIFEEVLRARHLPLDRRDFERAFAEVDARFGAFVGAYLDHPAGVVDLYNARNLEQLGIEDPRGEIVADLHEAFTSPRWHRPYPESDEVLRELELRGVALHIVSNNTELLPETLRKLGWAGRFASVTYSQEAGAEKPDPRIFRLALERAKVSPREVVHVGDSWTADVVGATQAGLRAVWLNREDDPPPGPCDTVRDLRGIVQLLAG